MHMLIQKHTQKRRLRSRANKGLSFGSPQVTSFMVWHASCEFNVCVRPIILRQKTRSRSKRVHNAHTLLIRVSVCVCPPSSPCPCPLRLRRSHARHYVAATCLSGGSIMRNFAAYSKYYILYMWASKLPVLWEANSAAPAAACQD